ncbi:hypothetical protein ACQJBY_030183 [Aegilops geniculata]
MAALLRFAARKVCGHAGLERPLQGSFMAARSIAVVKEDEPRKLPWTIFHGRLRSLHWFSSSPESPYDPLTNNHKHFPVSLGTRGPEEKRQELLRLLREMDDLQAERCAMEIKKNTKLLPSKPWSAEDFKRHFGVDDFQGFILSLPFMAMALLLFVAISMMTIFILLMPLFLLYAYYCTSTSRTGQKYKEHTLSAKDLA